MRNDTPYSLTSLSVCSVSLRQPVCTLQHLSDAPTSAVAQVRALEKHVINRPRTGTFALGTGCRHQVAQVRHQHTQPQLRFVEGFCDVPVATQNKFHHSKVQKIVNSPQVQYVDKLVNVAVAVQGPVPTVERRLWPQARTVACRWPPTMRFPRRC